MPKPAKRIVAESVSLLVVGVAVLGFAKWSYNTDSAFKSAATVVTGEITGKDWRTTDGGRTHFVEYRYRVGDGRINSGTDTWYEGRESWEALAPGSPVEVAFVVEDEGDDRTSVESRLAVAGRAAVPYPLIVVGVVFLAIGITRIVLLRRRQRPSPTP